MKINPNDHLAKVLHYTVVQLYKTISRYGAASILEKLPQFCKCHFTFFSLHRSQTALMIRAPCRPCHLLQNSAFFFAAVTYLTEACLPAMLRMQSTIWLHWISVGGKKQLNSLNLCVHHFWIAIFLFAMTTFFLFFLFLPVANYQIMWLHSMFWCHNFTAGNLT